MDDIPIVDFSCLSLHKDKIPEEPNEQVTKLSQEIFHAFTSIGFVYIKNHGIQEEQIKNMIKVGDKFFELPYETKAQSKTCLEKYGNEHGWTAPEQESFDLSKPGDYKEAFDVVEPYNDSLAWPVVEISSFKETFRAFFEECRELTMRILDLISLGLKLKDSTLLRRTHKKIGQPGNNTSLRLLLYPAVEKQLKEGQTRCGEHTDYGTFTLLFQDSVGGLEVQNRKKEFVHARPIEGTVLVNVADLLQRWTNDKLVSTRHRVGLPKQDSLPCAARHAIAFFVIPDSDVLIECLDGSNSYPPVNALDYLNQRLADTYT